MLLLYQMQYGHCRAVQLLPELFPASSSRLADVGGAVSDTCAEQLQLLGALHGALAAVPMYIFTFSSDVPVHPMKALHTMCLAWLLKCTETANCTCCLFLAVATTSCCTCPTSWSAS